MRTSKELWPGGYVRRQEGSDGRRGRATYYIERMVSSERFHVSTRCHELRAAMKQLERFEADPAAYRPLGAVGAKPIFLTADLSREFLDWSKERGNSLRWRTQQREYLAWWTERLSRVDLRLATLRDHVMPPLAGATCRAHRIAVIKRLYGWLRRERHDLTSAEDPTLDLSVPQSKPAQWKKSKVVPRENYRAVRKHLSGHWLDGLDVLAATGWHGTELARFAKDGEIEPYPKGGAPDSSVAVLVVPRKKSGGPHRTAVKELTVAAAERLRNRGSFDLDKFTDALASACRAVPVPEFGYGMLRHSVATAALNSGRATLSQIGDFLGHADSRTTRRYYATLGVPRRVPGLA